MSGLRHAHLLKHQGVLPSTMSGFWCGGFSLGMFLLRGCITSHDTTPFSSVCFKAPRASMTYTLLVDQEEYGQWQVALISIFFYQGRSLEGEQAKGSH